MNKSACFLVISVYFEYVYVVSNHKRFPGIQNQLVREAANSKPIPTR